MGFDERVQLLRQIASAEEITPALRRRAAILAAAMEIQGDIQERQAETERRLAGLEAAAATALLNQPIGRI